MLPSGQGLFYARRVESGWDITGPWLPANKTRVWGRDAL